MASSERPPHASQPTALPGSRSSLMVQTGAGRRLWTATRGGSRGNTGHSVTLPWLHQQSSGAPGSGRQRGPPDAPLSIRSWLGWGLLCLPLSLSGSLLAPGGVYSGAQSMNIPPLPSTPGQGAASRLASRLRASSGKLPSQAQVGPVPQAFLVLSQDQPSHLHTSQIHTQPT